MAILWQGKQVRQDVYKRQGQDDLIWHKATLQADGSYRVTIKASDHKNDSGKYNVHVHFIDADNLSLIHILLGDIEVELGVDFFANREELESSAEKVVFTGMIDQYFDYKHGELEYRSLRFEHEVLDEENHQGNAVVNYTEREIPYTRIIEHKHFEYGTQPKTVITREYPADWKRGDEPYYPINDEKNNAMFAKYQEEAEKNDKVIFCGRLADYKRCV